MYFKTELGISEYHHYNQELPEDDIRKYYSPRDLLPLTGGSRYDTGSRWRNVALSIVLAFGLTAATYGYFQSKWAKEDQVRVSDLAKEVRGKLKGDIPLDPGERIYKEVIVVPSGRDYGEYLDRAHQRTPIPVMEYPASHYSSGGKVNELGSVSQDTIIPNVLWIDGDAPLSPVRSKYGAFECKNININLSKEDPGICYIWGINLQNHQK